MKVHIYKYRFQCGILLLLFMLLGLFIYASPQTFLHQRIYVAFMSTIPAPTVLALGLTLLIIAGEMDLSFPFIMAISGLAFAMVFQTTANPVLGLLAALAVGASAGLLNGLIVVHIGVPAIIATIGTQFFWRGAGTLLSDGLALNLTEMRGTTVLGNFSTDLMTGKKILAAHTITHGATVIATGGMEAVPAQYLYAAHPNVMTHLELDVAWRKERERISAARTVVFIQCVGSRNPERPYCSRVCCTHSLKSAMAFKEINPEVNVFILYRDIRSYGFRETLYTEARSRGVLFIRYDIEHPPEVDQEADALRVRVTEPILARPLVIHPDLPVLASAILPNENRALFEQFKVPVNSDGFLVEAHVKLTHFRGVKK